VRRRRAAALRSAAAAAAAAALQERLRRLVLGNLDLEAARTHSFNLRWTVHLASGRSAEWPHRDPPGWPRQQQQQQQQQQQHTAGGSQGGQAGSRATVGRVAAEATVVAAAGSGVGRLSRALLAWAGWFYAPTVDATDRWGVGGVGPVLGVLMRAC
jgi:hypothetical protein